MISASWFDTEGGFLGNLWISRPRVCLMNELLWIPSYYLFRVITGAPGPSTIAKTLTFTLLRVIWLILKKKLCLWIQIGGLLISVGAFGFSIGEWLSPEAEDFSSFVSKCLIEASFDFRLLSQYFILGEAPKLLRGWRV